jgi:hypothetical protein
MRSIFLTWQNANRWRTVSWGELRIVPEEQLVDYL